MEEAGRDGDQGAFRRFDGLDKLTAGQFARGRLRVGEAGLTGVGGGGIRD